MAENGRYHFVLFFLFCTGGTPRSTDRNVTSSVGEILTIQEFMPRQLNPYRDGLANAQLIRINVDKPGVDYLILRVAANVTAGCWERNVSLYLRYDGLPVANAKDSTYPNQTWVIQPVDYEVNFNSDNQFHSLTIQKPINASFSTLFGAAFVMDDSSAIVQQGITRSCTTLFWARIEFISSNTSDYWVLNNIENVLIPDAVNHWPTASLLIRKSYPQPLTVVWETDQGPNVTGNRSFVLNMTTGDAPALLMWSISSPDDLGGTLQVDLKINTDDGTNVTVRGCIAHETTDCLSGYPVSVNSSALEEQRKTKLSVPYPRNGNWFIIIEASCSEWTNATYKSNVTIEVQIALWQCISGSCGPYGRCVQYFSAGLIYSACVCHSGYTGYACTDDREAMSTSLLIASVLVLTLSNLFFIPAIVLAFHRRFYPQCMMYFLTMIFSTFYHACDQAIFSFCILPYKVLQFGDFYSALASVWTTALIVAHPQVDSAVEFTIGLAGVVAVAMSVHYDPTSLAAFLIPITCGLLLVFISWAFHGYHKHTCYPGKLYCLKAVLPCAVFSLVGVLCFAFLETEENYFYVHSIWHVTIALAIVFIMPKPEEQERQTLGCCTAHHIHHTEAQGVKWTETVSDYSFPVSST